MNLRSLLVVAGVLAAAPLMAQEPSIHLQSLFYGDNSEFRGPFRDGDTTFGSWIRLEGELPLGGPFRLRAGGIGNRVFGAEDGFTQGRPLLALVVGSDKSRFVFGTLERQRPQVGPDRQTPHGLLPPLQDELLSFTRPYEEGLQWRRDTTTGSIDTWMNWQKLNTPEHREKFDTGFVWHDRTQSEGSWIVVQDLQVHVVHHGGQLYMSGPVSDSVAASVGGGWGKQFGRTACILETHFVYSYDKPDRADAGRYTDGMGGFLRASVESGSWRGHAIAWGAFKHQKEEGDANYSGLKQDGSLYDYRHYYEAGLTKVFGPLRGPARLEVSGRIHRVEDQWNYSYRVLGVIDLTRVF